MTIIGLSLRIASQHLFLFAARSESHPLFKSIAAPSATPYLLQCTVTRSGLKSSVMSVLSSCRFKLSTSFWSMESLTLSFE